MDTTIQQAKDNFLQSKARLLQALNNTPDDKLNWSPTPTARTPIEIVIHSADALKNIHDMLDGRPFQISNTAEADKHFRESEKRISTREEVVELFEKNSTAYVAWLDALTPERLNDPITFPFGLGAGTVGIGLQFPALHTSSHTPQIEYIQTIYGDRDWHLNN